MLPAVVGLVAWTATAPAQPPVRVTVVGDSVSAALQYVAGARLSLARGFDARFDLAVCRRLATTGCPYRGGIPPSALDMVRGAGTSLGQVLVVDVGYNDDPHFYASGMDSLVQAAHAAGVKRIVWLTLRTAQPIYGLTNTVIRTEARKFPEVTVADWNAWSAGKPWFGSDGLHLSGSGATALAQFLRPYLLAAADSIRAES